MISGTTINALAHATNALDRTLGLQCFNKNESCLVSVASVANEILKELTAFCVRQQHSPMQSNNADKTIASLPIEEDKSAIFSNWDDNETNNGATIVGPMSAERVL
mmetsp:Transcript_8198/g.26146  ORF Transcript_8198/g.26146 Transcript_8198/m.26146 type:complete len:106 (-) Transcript_8198:1851-2168(-)